MSANDVQASKPAASRPRWNLRPIAVAVSMGLAEFVPIATAVAAENGIQALQRDYDLPSGPLAATLNRIARESGLALTIDAALLSGHVSAPVRGHFSAQEAMRRALTGSGLELVETDARTYTVHTAPSTPRLAPIVVSTSQAVTGHEAGVTTLPTVTVTEDGTDADGFKASYQDSATKTPLSIRETPQAISVITRDSMDKRQARDAASALELAAGVASAGSGHGGPFAGRGLGQGENFNLRGQDLNEGRDIRVDGFAVPSSAFDLAAYERIEAVKGPSSMLYGQGSLGGFINMVRKKPRAERAASVAATVASFDTRRMEGDATGALDADGRFRGLLTAAYDDSDSFTDGVETRIAMIGPSLEARIGERTRVLLQVLYQNDEYVPSQGVPLRIDGSRAHAPDVPRSIFVGMPSKKESTSDNLLASVLVEREIADRWLASLSLQQGRQDVHRFFDSYGYDFTGLATGDVTLVTDRAQIENDNWAGELRLDGRFDAFGHEHRLLLGAEQNERKNRTAFGYTILGSANIYDGDFAGVGTIPGGAASQPLDFEDGETTSGNRALYGQIVLSLAERTKLLAGLRYDRAKQERRDNLAGGVLTDSKVDKEHTLRLGVTRELSENMTVYASYAESFNPVDAITASGELLDPETGEGYELGLKTAWFAERLSASVAVFRQDLDNRPIPDPTDPDFSISGGLQRTKGVELEITGSPYRGLTIGAAAAWLDNKHIDRQDVDFGLKPYGSYDRMAALFASYEIQDGGWKGLGFGATLISIGKQSLSFAGNGDFYGTGTDELYVDGYERLDLNMYYKGFPDWDLSLQVRNVTDEIYIERVRDASGSNYFGSPTAVLFRAEYRFD